MILHDCVSQHTFHVAVTFTYTSPSPLSIVSLFIDSAFIDCGLKNNKKQPK